MKKYLKRILRKKDDSFPADMDPDFKKIYEECKDFTMTSRNRMYALYKSVEYIVKNEIPGDIVECGVWKGGSAMLCAMTLAKLGEVDRKIYLYDTYEGMSEPTEKDVSSNNLKAKDQWLESTQGNVTDWCLASLDEVKEAMHETGYPKEKLVFIKGKVEDTIPENIPDQVSILRLDTDWYESTYHEMKHLYPLLSRGGVLIIDDYGYWKGAREAVDKYIEENNIKILLNRVDHTGRVGIKID